jgi:hypothetical protein
MMVRRLSIASVFAVLAVLPGAAQALPSRLTLGFSSDPHLTAGTSASRAPWIAKAVSDDADLVRVNLIWSAIAPKTRPAGFDPSDPSSPSYNWSTADAPIRDLTAAGFKVLVTIWNAPAWAEGPDRPSSVQPGTWRPDPRQFAQFATAAARRYDGTYPDPTAPLTTLPRVGYWQGWNEPDLDYYFSPQWTCSRGKCASAAPALYREMENDFYGAVKAVDPANFVVLAGTGPYGDPIGTVPLGKERTPPVQWYRDVLSAPIRLDAVDHHPYGVGGPHWHALNPDDIAVPDIYKITRVLNAAQRAGHSLPRGPKAVWITEIGWSSKPPNPKAVPIEQDARWIEQAMYVLWRQGVDTVLLLELGDPPPIPNLESVFESGIYYLDGDPKPGVTAFRFPFVTRRLGRGRVEAWGRAPAAGDLEIQRLQRRRWRTLRTLRVAARQMFDTTVSLSGQASLRAQVDSEASLVWTQGS